MKTDSDRSSKQAMGEQLLLGTGEPEPGVPTFSRDIAGSGSKPSRFRRPTLTRHGKIIGFEPLKRCRRASLAGTLRTAWKAGRPTPAVQDLVSSVACSPASRLSIFVLDVSDSMAPALDLMRSWLESRTREAYFRRDPMALITVQGQMARVLAQPTTSHGLVLNRLQSVRVGGGTPLGQGLILVRKMIVQWRNHYPDIDLCLITDGRSTSALTTPAVRQATAVIANQARTVRLVNASGNSQLENLARLLRATLVIAQPTSGGQP